MKHCKARNKKHHHKYGDAVLNRVVSLLLTGLEMAIFGKLAKTSSNVVASQNNNTNVNSKTQSNKRKKCGSCNGRDCATCIKI